MSTSLARHIDVRDGGPGGVIIDCIQFPSLKFGTFPISKFGTFPISKFGMFPTSKFGTFLI